MSFVNCWFGKTCPLCPITFDTITPAWVTAVLARHGALIDGEVIGVVQQRDPNPVTANATLLLTYSPAARGECPARLFFKQSPQPAEAIFYRHVAPLLGATAAPICYDAQYDAAHSHVLLGFVAQTHFVAPELVPMPRADTELIVDALAALHSRFWDAPHSAPQLVALARDVPAFSFTVASRHFAAFADALGDRLSPRRRALYARIFAAYPTYRPAGPLTVVHGDAHWGNFLYPHDRVAHRLVLIDWAVWHINHGVGDLAYTLALQCSPERRSWIEQPLVRRYHDRLLAAGIPAYPWAECWDAYRRMVIEQCLWPIVWHHFDLPAAVWWYALECTLAAFDDLDCAEFLP